MVHRGFVICLCAALCANAEEPPVQRETIEVIGLTPVEGIGLDVTKFPTNAQRLTHGSSEITRDLGSGTSLSLQDPQGGLLQSDLQFRGFALSPLLGAPESLAVFLDGTRLNEPFGDTVAWTAVPSTAVESIELIPGANPAHGLNALGGVIALRTRSRASDTKVTVEAGSFGRRDVQLSTGGGRWFVSGGHLRDAGWRDHSPGEASHLFGSTRWSSGRARLTLSSSRVTGNGAAPEMLLDERREAVFTHPDDTDNDTAIASLSQHYALTPRTLLDFNGSLRHSRTRTFNGDDSPYEPCDDSGFVCLDGDVVHDRSGAPILANEEYDATNNRSRLSQTAFSVSGQFDAAWSTRHRVIGGASIDSGAARFRFSTELAELTADRGTRGFGIVDAGSLVELDARSGTISLFAADVFTPRPRLTITTTARFNRARIQLDDRIGTALEGDHSFAQFHPSIGFAWELSPRLIPFANAALAGRTPTPVELTCADPDDPCRLPNAFVSDPPLRDVTGSTLEAGLRGRAGAISWSGAIHRSESRDDIIFISSGPLRGEGHFANVGRTRRQGLELQARGRNGSRFLWHASYAWLDATFRTPFTVSAPNHPDATDDELHVERGDRLPLVPRHVFSVGSSLEVTRRARIAADVRGASRQYMRGDEANLARPLDGYVVTDLRFDYALSPNARAIVGVRNLFDARHATFGLFGEADEVLGDAYEGSSRFVTPAAPRSFIAGIELRL